MQALQAGMKTSGIIFDIKKFAIHDGPGIRTTVFFKGCPLDCWWCHNPESRKLEPETVVKTDSRFCPPETTEVIGREISVEEVMAEVNKDTVFYDESGGGVTFSGGEPLMQPDFLNMLLSSCKQYSLHTAVDTTGYASYSTISKIYDNVDLFLYDLKLINEEQHRKYTGVSNKPILENLKRLSQNGKKIIIRIPIIPGITDMEENITGIARLLQTLPATPEVNILPYNLIGESKYQKFSIPNRLGKIEPPSDEQMNELKNKLEAFALKVKIGG